MLSGLGRREPYLLLPREDTGLRGSTAEQLEADYPDGGGVVAPIGLVPETIYYPVLPRNYPGVLRCPLPRLPRAPIGRGSSGWYRPGYVTHAVPRWAARPRATHEAAYP